jgi:hypothetical protein
MNLCYEKEGLMYTQANTVLAYCKTFRRPTCSYDAQLMFHCNNKMWLVMENGQEEAKHLPTVHIQVIVISNFATHEAICAITNSSYLTW